MKVKVKDIEFNPFRNTRLVPIDPLTVDKLKRSIDDLGLWDGMTARPKGNDWNCGKYEIPFAHHRLVAIRELGFKEIEISVNEISDFNMVLMMVQENMTQRGVSNEMINGTVREVKEFLEGELIKYTTWKEVEMSHDFVRLFSDARNPISTFAQLKSKGIGELTILKFLKSSIPQWRIRSALDLIKNKDIDIEAVNVLKSTGQQEGFKNAIRKVNKKKAARGEEPIPFAKHKELAEKIIKTASPGKTGGGNYYKSMENIILKELITGMNLRVAINEIHFDLDGIAHDSRRLADKISNLNGKLHTMGVEELKTFSSLSLINDFLQLLGSLNVLTNTLGIQINKLKN